MMDHESKIFEATKAKITKSQAEGYILNLKELKGLIIWVGMIAIINLYGYFKFNDFKNIIVNTKITIFFDDILFKQFLQTYVLKLFSFFIPLLIILWVYMLTLSFVFNGFKVHSKKISFKFKFKALLSIENSVFLLVNVIKISLIITCTVLALYYFTDEWMAVTTFEIKNLLILTFKISFLILSLFILSSIVDAFLQIYFYNKNLKMTKFEMQEELKNTQMSQESKQMQAISSKRIKAANREKNKVLEV